MPAPAEPTTTIKTNNPVWRARHLPFGDGVLALPQRGPSALQMWGRDGREPLETFAGYDAPVKEFVWRTRGGKDPQFEDREFQLITWSKDRKFRIIPVTTDVLERAGYRRGAPIDVLVSRRNAPDISYANWDGDSMSGATPLTPTPCSEMVPPYRVKSGFFPDMKYAERDRLRTMPLRQRVEAILPVPTPFLSKQKVKGGESHPPVEKKAVMTRGVVGGKRRKRKGIDQMDWIGGVSTVSHLFFLIGVQDLRGHRRSDAKKPVKNPVTILRTTPAGRLTSERPQILHLFLELGPWTACISILSLYHV